MATEPFLGELMIVPFGGLPSGWALCDGQLLSIQQNAALFALLGTTYGGNGVNTFGLPDLRSCVALGQGIAPGGTQYVLGERGGAEAVTLISAHLPLHTHSTSSSLTAAQPCVNAPADQATPVANCPAIEAGHVTAVYASNDDSNMNAGAISVSGVPAIGVTGQSQPHGNLQPFLALGFCIALQGIFPARN